MTNPTPTWRRAALATAAALSVTGLAAPAAGAREASAPANPRSASAALQLPEAAEPLAVAPPPRNILEATSLAAWTPPHQVADDAAAAETSDPVQEAIDTLEHAERRRSRFLEVVETKRKERLMEAVAEHRARRAEAERLAAERAAAERAEARRVQARRSEAARAESQRSSTRRTTTRGGGAGDMAGLRNCESGGNYGAVSSSGTYRGAYQFSRSTWNSVASSSHPHLVGVDPASAAPADQDAMARSLRASSGSSPWPVCGRHL